MESCCGFRVAGYELQRGAHELPVTSDGLRLTSGSAQLCGREEGPDWAVEHECALRAKSDFKMQKSKVKLADVGHGRAGRPVSAAWWKESADRTPQHLGDLQEEDC